MIALGGDNIGITVVEGAGHSDGWLRRWRELLAEPL